MGYKDDLVWNVGYAYRQYKEMVEEYNPGFYLYFVTDEQYVKIGIARHPNVRLASIQTGNPRKCTILFLIPCKDKQAAIMLENALHYRFEAYRLCGEWFNILEDIVLNKWCDFWRTVYNRAMQNMDERSAQIIQNTFFRKYAK